MSGFQFLCIMEGTEYKFCRSRIACICQICCLQSIEVAEAGHLQYFIRHFRGSFPLTFINSIIYHGKLPHSLNLRTFIRLIRRTSSIQSHFTF